MSFAGAVGHLFILCHPQRLKIMRRVFIIFGTVRFLLAVVCSIASVVPEQQLREFCCLKFTS